MKPTDADRDPAFDGLIARGLECETDASGNACPDADLLAAWFDRSLSPLETDRIEAHASSCACCQQILADLARSEPEVTRAAPVPAPARPWHWHWRWLVPLATAAVVVVVGTRTLRAPGPLLISAARPATLGDRPATWVELQQAQPTARPPAQSAGATGAPAATGRVAQNAPIAPAALDKAPAESTAAPRTQDEFAKAMPAPPPTTTLKRLIAEKRESVRAEQKTPPAAANADAPRYISRESTMPLLSTTAAGPSGTTTTWRYGQGGAIERSTDRGQTWERQQSGVTNALADGSAPTDRVCWIVGDRGVVLRTTDGRTWQRLASPTLADLVSVHAWSDSNATVIATDGSEYETTDGGRSWQRR